MKAATYYEQGAPDVFCYEDIPDPVCHRKGIVIRVGAISVEGGDLLNRSGNLAPIAATPHVVGYQAAGEIVEVGGDVEGLVVGQRAVATYSHGSHAELFAAPARNAWLIPEGMDVVRAAAVPVAFGTANEALNHYGRLQAGETVLVHAGAGGVGTAAMQIARHLGARVLATGSSDDKLKRLSRLGLDYGINHLREDVVEQVMRATGGKGADVVVDTIGGETLQVSIDCLAKGGRVVMTGQASRQAPKVNVDNLMPAQGLIVGFSLDIGLPRIHETIQQLLSDCASGRYEVVIDRTFPLSDVVAAHTYIESRTAVGRVLLLP